MMARSGAFCKTVGAEAFLERTRCRDSSGLTHHRFDQQLAFQAGVPMDMDRSVVRG